LLIVVGDNNNKNIAKSSIFVDVDNDKYCNKKCNIIETKTLKNFEYYSILFAKKTKNFVKQKIKLDTKFREKYNARYTTRNKIFASFSTILKNKKVLVYKKERSRKKRILIKQEIIN